MPYARTTKTWRKRASPQAKAALAGIQKSLRKKIKRLPLSAMPKQCVPEMKRKDHVIENSVFLLLNNTLGTVTKCFNISEGTGLQQRVGRKIQARGIHVKGHFFNPTGNPAVFIRMFVIQDKSEPNDEFTGDDFFIKGGAPVDHNQGTEAAYLNVNKNRYKVYSDKMMKLSSANTNAENIQIFNTFIKLNVAMKYSDNTTDGLVGPEFQVVYFGCSPSGAIVSTERITANMQITNYYNDV